MAPPVYFQAQFGDLPLLISDISTERGRDIAVQSPSQGDEHTLFDRGKRVVRATCSILFVNQPGLESYTDRYEAFLRLAEAPEAQIFSHPLDGSYRARAAELAPAASSDSGGITIGCTFLRDAEPKQVFDVAAGGTSVAGVEGVSIAMTATTDALAAIGASSSAPAACLAAVTSWTESEDLDSQEVFLGAASLAQQIDEAIDELELEADLSRWQAYREMILLRYQVVLVAELLTSAAEALFDVYVETPRPLLAICAEVYGAAAAVERATEVAGINRIRTPGRVPPGTTLKMPRPS